MCSLHASNVVLICSRSQARMQAVSDLLLLTSGLRPVTTDSLAVFGQSLGQTRETIITRTRGLQVLTRRIMEELYSVMGKWEDISGFIEDMCDIVVGLIECSAHAAYLVAISQPLCIPAIRGIVDPYKMSLANVEIELVCREFRQVHQQELSPTMLLRVCSDINRNLTSMTECCRQAGDSVDDLLIKDQFRMCVKSFTSTARCLVNSVRCFKTKPCELHHKHCLSFGEALVSSTRASMLYATGDRFIGKAAVLTPDGHQAKKAVLGCCLSIVSSCIQMCKTIRELAYDNMNSILRERLVMCTESVAGACNTLVLSLPNPATSSSTVVSSVLTR